MKKSKPLLLFFISVLLGWIAGTSTVYQFKNPSKTQTEAFLHIPKSIA